jgi:hypothetical protein
MQDEETLTSRTYNHRLRQLPCPGLKIDVAPHGMGGSEVPQLLKDV